MRALGILALLLISSAPQGPPPPMPETSTSTALARQWVERLTAVMKNGATRQDVDNLLALYTDDAVYEHPRMRARTRGKRKIRAEMAEFLGETRSPNLRIKSTIEGRNVVVLELEIQAEAKGKDAWQPLTRTQVTVLETDGSRIRRIVDYW